MQSQIDCAYQWYRVVLHTLVKSSSNYPSGIPINEWHAIHRGQHDTDSGCKIQVGLSVHRILTQANGFQVHSDFDLGAMVWVKTVVRLDVARQRMISSRRGKLTSFLEVTCHDGHFIRRSIILWKSGTEHTPNEDSCSRACRYQ